MTLHIPQAVQQQMVDHAKAAYPEECCGFMYGEDRGTDRYITFVEAVTNQSEDNRKRRFSIAPQAYMQAEQRALAEGVTLLGVYHSHPDHPAEPSEHDRKQAMPFFSYVILSIREGELAAWTSWQLDDQAETAEFAEEAVAPLF
jgi:proteasome lid subunit RPN8/RPN11